MLYLFEAAFISLVKLIFTSWKYIPLFSLYSCELEKQKQKQILGNNKKYLSLQALAKR